MPRPTRGSRSGWLLPWALTASSRVMAALPVFETACGKSRLSGSGMLYLVGVELTIGTSTCEIDFMILIPDGELPAFIIGEAKAGHPSHPAQGDLLSSDDLDHVEAIQDAF